MVKVITYGTYDLLHYGHIKLLERARQMTLIKLAEKSMCSSH